MTENLAYLTTTSSTLENSIATPHRYHSLVLPSFLLPIVWNYLSYNVTYSQMEYLRLTTARDNPKYRVILVFQDFNGNPVTIPPLPVRRRVCHGSCQTSERV